MKFALSVVILEPGIRTIIVKQVCLFLYFYHLFIVSGFVYYCKICRKRESPTLNTFFDNAQLSFQQILFIIYYWSQKCKAKFIAKETRVSEHTIVDYINFIRLVLFLFCREVCFWRLSVLEGKIGGIGKTVEIDETKLFKRKYNEGRIIGLSGWLVGGIERDDKRNMFMVLVQDRTSETLNEIIINHVERGTRIITDCWAGYNGLTALGYTHETVNHSTNFVSPTDPSVYTQNIEVSWRYIKSSCRSTSNDEEMLIYRLSEYLYRKKYSGECLFAKILEDIAENFSPLNI